MRSLREQRGWTQAELAERLGVHPNTVARWERGERVPSLPLRRLIAVTFGVASDAIVYGPVNEGRPRGRPARPAPPPSAGA